MTTGPYPAEDAAALLKGGSAAELPLSPAARTATGRIATGLGLASAAMVCVFQSIQQVLIPFQIQQIDPVHKVQDLAVLTTLAAGLAVLGSVAGGALSDRTMSRFGRRSPWLIGMAVASAALLGAMSALAGLALIATVYAALWFCMNFYQSVLSAIVPDRVPQARRGTVSSAMGLGGALGLGLGVNAVARLSVQQGYWALSGLIVVITLLCVGLVQEWRGGPAPATAPPQTPVSRTSLLLMFKAFASRDFTLAFVTRLTTFTAATTVAGYTYYILQDHVGAANLPGHSVKVAVGLLTGAQTLAWIVGVTGAGWLSDRFDRRKLFVGICSIGLALTMLVPLVSSTWVGFLIFSTLVGLFFGTYLAVDLALMTLVLPSRVDEGRDLALLSVANSAPQLMSPAIAAGIIALAGYNALFWFAFVAALISGVAVFFIRSVR